MDDAPPVLHLHGGVLSLPHAMETEQVALRTGHVSSAFPTSSWSDSI